MYNPHLALAAAEEGESAIPQAQQFPIRQQELDCPGPSFFDTPRTMHSQVPQGQVVNTHLRDGIDRALPAQLEENSGRGTCIANTHHLYQGIANMQHPNDNNRCLDVNERYRRASYIADNTQIVQVTSPGGDSIDTGPSLQLPGASTQHPTRPHIPQPRHQTPSMDNSIRLSPFRTLPGSGFTGDPALQSQQSPGRGVTNIQHLSNSNNRRPHAYVNEPLQRNPFSEGNPRISTPDFNRISVPQLQGSPAPAVANTQNLANNKLPPHVTDNSLRQYTPSSGTRSQASAASTLPRSADRLLVPHPQEIPGIGRSAVSTLNLNSSSQNPHPVVPDLQTSLSEICINEDQPSTRAPSTRTTPDSSENFNNDHPPAPSPSPPPLPTSSQTPLTEAAITRRLRACLHHWETLQNPYQNPQTPREIAAARYHNTQRILDPRPHEVDALLNIPTIEIASEYAPQLYQARLEEYRELYARSSERERLVLRLRQMVAAQERSAGSCAVRSLGCVGGLASVGTFRACEDIPCQGNESGWRAVVSRSLEHEQVLMRQGEGQGALGGKEEEEK